MNALFSRLAPLALLFFWSGAQAASAAVDTGDTAFVLVCAALVMLMTPGLALFYGGLVPAKSVLNTMMMSMAALGVAGVLWVIVGYSLAFGDGGGPLIGSLRAVDVGSLLGQRIGSIPAPAFMVFQTMFAIITLAVVSGSVVERMRFPAFLLFGALWTLCIYAPLAHWVWSSDGWLNKLGLLDFAGGTVVETASGVSGLVAAAVVGPRFRSPSSASIPHNVPFVLLGAGLLWFGWLGFNAGSALGANQLAALAFLNTTTAASAAVLTWMLWEVLRGQRPSAVGAATGAVVGLVAITPACGYVSPGSALIIGALATSAAFFAVQYRHHLRADDALDVFACHGVAGITGTLLTGVFARHDLNAAGRGLLDGHGAQIGVQALGVLAAVALAALGTLAILKLTSLLTHLRLPEHFQTRGMDLASHAEEGYAEVDNGLTAPVLLGGD